MTHETETNTSPEATRLINSNFSSPNLSRRAPTSHFDVAEGAGPQPSHNQVSKYLTIAVDFFVLSVSFGHLVFVCVIASKNGWFIDNQYDQFQSLLTALAPIFPMVFAFVTGRFLYQATRLQLEKGSSLGTLEQLMGSQTLGAAAATHFKLNAFNPLGLGILSLWIFSPLGGQSLLRLLHISNPSYVSAFIYMDLQMRSSFLDSGQSKMNNSYILALAADDEILSGPTDIWGNVKIPFLESTVRDAADNETWHEYRGDEEISNSSAVGIPIAWVAPINSSLNIESNYIHLESQPIEKHTVEDNANSFFPTETVLNQTALENLTHIHSIPNGSWYGYQALDSNVFAHWNIALDRFVDGFWSEAFHPSSETTGRDPSQVGLQYGSFGIFQNETGIEAGPTKLLFQYGMNVSYSEGGTPTNTSEKALFKTQCNVLQKYVESRLSCCRIYEKLRPNCKVVAQRPSLKSYPPETLSVLSVPDLFSTISKTLPSLLVDNTSPTLDFIGGNSGDPTERMLPNLSDISAQNFSRKLGQALNSFYLANQIGTFQNRKTIPGSKNITLQEWVSAMGTSSGLQLKYSISWPWAAAAIASCLILCVAGILGVYYVHQSRGPEVLGYISTIVRESAEAAAILSHIGEIDGDELTKILKTTRLRYGWKNLSREGKGIGIGPEEGIRAL